MKSQIAANSKTHPISISPHRILIYKINPISLKASKPQDLNKKLNQYVKKSATFQINMNFSTSATTQKIKITKNNHKLK